MSATVTIACQHLGTRCTVPGVDVSLHLHPSGAPMRVEWSCPVCTDRHDKPVGRPEAAVYRAAGARVVRAGRSLDEEWIKAAARQVVADAQAACLDAARSR